jgi:predicted ArsR family transcriptional regulator
MIDEGITVSELAEKLKTSRHAVEVRLSRLGIKPISYEARYPSDTYERLKSVKRGRPSKKTPAPPSTDAP